MINYLKVKLFYMSKTSKWDVYATKEPLHRQLSAATAWSIPIKIIPKNKHMKKGHLSDFKSGTVLVPEVLINWDCHTQLTAEFIENKWQVCAWKCLMGIPV